MSDSAALRAEAAKLITAVVHQGRSLSDTLPPAQAALDKDADRRLLGALVYGSLRWYGRLEGLLSRFLDRAVPRKQRVLHGLMICGLYEQHYLSTPDHAVVSETVSAARRLGHPRAAGMVNAILRRAQREGGAVLAELDTDPVRRHAHPGWLVRRLEKDWPERWEAILAANNSPAPFWLRVNRQHVGREDYQRLLQGRRSLSAAAPEAVPTALLLDQGTDVERLPGFDTGQVSVQDGAAQLAGHCLDVAPGQRVLDACAAPGNKTAHLLELADGRLDLTALDASGERLERLRRNLQRGGYSARVLEADAAEPAGWWDGRPFDRILLDAPCSATGVIRRHPDIKWLRRDEDIEDLVRLQERMLKTLWPLLAPGGRLLYSTCSVFRDENDRQVRRFLETTGDAREVSLPLLEPVATALNPGYQLLPGDSGMDGFYYVALEKVGSDG